MKFYRKKDLIKIFGVGKTTIENWVRNGIFPKPIRFGANTIAWEESVILEYIESCKKATA